MSLIMTSGPALEPVSLVEAKAQLRVDADDEDVLIAGLITAARLHIETRLCRALVSQDWELWLDTPAAVARVMRLPLAPVQAVTGVTVFNDAGEAADMPPGHWFFDPVSQPARLMLTAPLPPHRRHSGLRIAFTAGYGPAAADVPAPLRQAMLLLVAHWFAEREPVMAGAGMTELPLAITALLAPYRRIAL